jgi:hypothetical protein
MASNTFSTIKSTVSKAVSKSPKVGGPTTAGVQGIGAKPRPQAQQSTKAVKAQHTGPSTFGENVTPSHKVGDKVYWHAIHGGFTHGKVIGHVPASKESHERLYHIETEHGRTAFKNHSELHKHVDEGKETEHTANQKLAQTGRYLSLAKPKMKFNTGKGENYFDHVAKKTMGVKEETVDESKYISNRSEWGGSHDSHGVEFEHHKVKDEHGNDAIHVHHNGEHIATIRKQSWTPHKKIPGSRLIKYMSERHGYSWHFVKPDQHHGDRPRYHDTSEHPSVKSALQSIANHHKSNAPKPVSEGLRRPPGESTLIKYHGHGYGSTQLTGGGDVTHEVRHAMHPIGHVHRIGPKGKQARYQAVPKLGLGLHDHFMGFHETPAKAIKSLIDAHKAKHPVSEETVDEATKLHGMFARGKKYSKTELETWKKHAQKRGLVTYQDKHSGEHKAMSGHTGKHHGSFVEGSGGVLHEEVLDEAGWSMEHPKYGTVVGHKHPDSKIYKVTDEKHGVYGHAHGRTPHEAKANMNQDWGNHGNMVGKVELVENAPAMSAGTGGYSGASAAAGPTAGFDPIMKAKKQEDNKKYYKQLMAKRAAPKK